jgi:hypothetical protein
LVFLLVFDVSFPAVGAKVALCGFACGSVVPVKFGGAFGADVRVVPVVLGLGWD